MPTHRRPISLLAVAGLAIAANALAASGARTTDDPVESTAGDYANAEFMSGPQDVPGVEKGPRERPEPPEAPKPTPEPAKRDWFGSKPYWEWSRATGDWAGLRTQMEDIGLTVSGSFKLDWSSVWSGGLANRASSRNFFDVNASLDTEKAFGLKGGTAFIDFVAANGRGGSADVGDLQGTSNIAAPRSLCQLNMVWYEQKLFDDVLRIKVGKIDANTEFAFVAAGAEFISASPGFSPTITGLPAYPDPATGINVFVYPAEKVYVGIGFYDGSAAVGVHTGSTGPASMFHGNEYFLIGEIGCSWDDCLGLGAGRVGIGGYGHTASFTRFDGSMQRGAAGAYIVAEQQLWTPGDKGEAKAEGQDDAGEDDKGLFAFAQFGYGDPNITAFNTHLAGGLTLKGTCECRPDDVAGLYTSWVHTSRATGSTFDADEVSFEVFYKFAVTPFLSVKPDLQYIINPGGTKAANNAVVGAVRVEISF